MEHTGKRSYESPKIEVVGALVDHILGLTHGILTDASLPRGVVPTLS